LFLAGWVALDQSSILVNDLLPCSYGTSYSLETKNGLVRFPDILVCTSSPWDMEKVQKLNISVELLAYLNNFLFPFGGFGKNESSVPGPIFKTLDDKYKTLLEKFDRNALYLLKNISKTCEKLIKLCFFGIEYTTDQCCQFFSPPEFILSFMCIRTNWKFYLGVQEAGMMNSVLITVQLNNSEASFISNSSLISVKAGIVSGQVAVGVINSSSHTYLSLARQDTGVTSNIYSVNYFLIRAKGILFFALKTVLIIYKQKGAYANLYCMILKK